MFKYNTGTFQYVDLMANNWQKWKSTFLTCPWYEIYREEAVGLKNSKYTLKIMIFVNDNVKFWVISWNFNI